MSLESDQVERLRKKLYEKAKREPDFRFYTLYDKVCWAETLQRAYRQAKANAGTAGVDGVRFEDIEAYGVDRWLAELRQELLEETYRAQPVRRVMIPKPGGGERPLGIPTIRDRVVQTAVVLFLGPIFEADFEDNVYAYRPERSAHDALSEVRRRLYGGQEHVVDADVTQYFDTIPHAELLQSVARRVADGKILRLLQAVAEIAGGGERWGKKPADDILVEYRGGSSPHNRAFLRAALQRHQEPHQLRVRTLVGHLVVRCLRLVDRAGLQGGSLHLEIDFGVSVGSLQGDLAQPRADGVDVDTGAQEMDSRGVPDSVRADALALQRRRPSLGLVML